VIPSVFHCSCSASHQPTSGDAASSTTTLDGRGNVRPMGGAAAALAAGMSPPAGGIGYGSLDTLLASGVTCRRVHPCTCLGCGGSANRSTLNTPPTAINSLVACGDSTSYAVWSSLHTVARCAFSRHPCARCGRVVCGSSHTVSHRRGGTTCCDVMTTTAIYFRWNRQCLENGE
jgi:hypothetical protein